jgi:hypothetical protein
VVDIFYSCLFQLRNKRWGSYTRRIVDMDLYRLKASLPQPRQAASAYATVHMHGSQVSHAIVERY